MTPCLKRDTFQKPSVLVSILDFFLFGGGTILHENLKIIWQTPTMVQQNRQPPATWAFTPSFSGGIKLGKNALSFVKCGSKKPGDVNIPKDFDS